MMSVDNNMTR